MRERWGQIRASQWGQLRVSNAPVWLATDPACGTVTGKYFADGRQVRCRFAGDRAGFEALFATCLLF